MGLHCCLEPNDAGRARENVMDESKSKKRSEQRSECQGHRIVRNEKERAKQGKKTPN
jgi:hypothetical protein